jgi:hypothetical protein
MEEILGFLLDPLAELAFEILAEGVGLLFDPGALRDRGRPQTLFMLADFGQPRKPVDKNAEECSGL